MRKTQIVSLIIIVAALLFGSIYVYQTQKTREQAITPVVKNAVGNEKTYKNENYGCAFNMYRPIREFKITESTTDYVSGYMTMKDAVSFITFYEPTTNKDFGGEDGYYLMHKIMVIPTDKWIGGEYYDDTDKRGDKWIANRIGTSGSYTVALLDTYGRDAPKDLILTQAMMNDNFTNFQSFSE